METVTYKVITAHRMGRGRWSLVGHIEYDNMRLIGTVATLEEVIQAIKPYAVPTLFCAPDSVQVREFFAPNDQIAHLERRIQDLDARYGAEYHYARQLKQALDADPIKQAEAANEALMQENAALRNDIQRLQEALDGGLLGEVLSLRQEARLVGQYAEYYHQARMEGQGNPNDPNAIYDDVAMPWEMWVDAYATTPNEREE